MTTTKTRTIRDSYLQLIRRFPLRPLRNEAEHDEATRVVQDLMGRGLDAGEADYLDALLVFVGQYEDAHHALDETMTPAQAIHALMDANDLKPVDLRDFLGSQSAVSMILSGARQPSKNQIAALCDRFRVSADLFMGL